MSRTSIFYYLPPTREMTFLTYFLYFLGGLSLVWLGFVMLKLFCQLIVLTAY